MSDHIQRISKAYLIDDKEKLTQFVVNNQEIITLLLEAQKQTRKIGGLITVLVLI